jgi:hypothetical protein
VTFAICPNKDERAIIKSIRRGNKIIKNKRRKLLC